MSENASVSRQYLNQIRHYQCTLNEGSKKNTGHLTPCWIREAQLYEKAKVLGQMLHCSKCWYAYGTSRGKRLQRQAGKAPVTGSSSALHADKPETHRTDCTLWGHYGWVSQGRTPPHTERHASDAAQRMSTPLLAAEVAAGLVESQGSQGFLWGG